MYISHFNTLIDLNYSLIIKIVKQGSANGSYLQVFVEL